MSRKKHSYEGFYTTRVKFYPASACSAMLIPAEVVQFDRPVFNPFSIEEKESDVKTSVTRSACKDESASAKNKSRALSRARHNICDLVNCNYDLDLFVTLTFDQKQIDRYSYTEIIKNLKIWLSNRSQRHGLKYVLVPEYHQDSAIHFHGFFVSSAVRLDDSGHKTKNGETIYNIADFPYGFTTGILIPDTSIDRIRVSRYILKYVTKDSEKVGGRYYLHGGELVKPRYAYSNDIISDDIVSADPYVFAPFDGATCKLYDCSSLSDDEKRQTFLRFFQPVVEK